MRRSLLVLTTLITFFFITACSAMSDQNNKLEGSWTVDTLNNSEVEGSRKPYIDFLEDEKIAGSTGCNRLSGKATQSDGTIKFTGLVSTKRACVENNVMQQERRILEALDTIVEVNQKQNSVELLDTYGNVIITLTKK